VPDGQDSKAGHRQRLRERSLATGGGLPDIGRLELLLTYAIPRRDVASLAGRLLERSGTLSGVVQASVHELDDTEGVGDRVATLIKLVAQLSRIVDTPILCESATTQQPTLFELRPAPVPEKEPPTRSKSSRRKVVTSPRTELFANAVLKEAIALLPGAPETESAEEIRSYLRDGLHYSAAQTRQRYANYIVRRMFPDDQVDTPMLVFARAFPNTQALRDACYYRFLRAEPLEVQIVEDLLLPNLGNGRVGRDRIRQYLVERFPDSKSIKDCGQAAVDALRAAGIANSDRTGVSFALRKVPLPSFAFVLHSEFPEPGMYDTFANSKRASSSELCSGTRSASFPPLRIAQPGVHQQDLGDRQHSSVHDKVHPRRGRRAACRSRGTLMKPMEIIEALRVKLTVPGGRHLYGVLGTCTQLEAFAKKLHQAKTPYGTPFPRPVNVNPGILDAIPDDEFRQLAENDAKRPEPSAAHVAKAFGRSLRANLTGQGILVLSNMEMLFAYKIELNPLRTLAADEDRVLLLLPGRPSGGRIIMFHSHD
jgi:hypothetical protein